MIAAIIFTLTKTETLTHPIFTREDFGDLSKGFGIPILRSKDRIRLFFSYRYTTPMIQEILKSYGIKVLDYWEAANQEEGVYLCQKL
ncbi:MAG: L-histidine N(alpha)-methyltransferase [Moorea sp. SIO3I7]|nr:L-histidine N(alpha)-methyltransferase [Moorena sp. SIO3I7]